MVQSHDSVAVRNAAAVRGDMMTGIILATDKLTMIMVVGVCKAFVKVAVSMMKPFRINEKKVDIKYATTTRTTKMKITKSILTLL